MNQTATFDEVMASFENVLLAGGFRDR